MSDSPKTLQTVHRRHVVFEPSNEKHRAAYWRLRTEGRQDENLRFVLEEKFGSVLTMMQTKIADHFSQPAPAEVATLRRKERA